MTHARDEATAAPVAPPFRAIDPAREARLRKALMAKGMGVNAQLVALKANQNARLLDLKLPHERKPGMTKEERLRAFLDQIIAAQRRLGTPAFGRCLDCGMALPDSAVDDCPWLERCAACEAGAT
jgi:RNA polymerase-binding transcription factor DksA